MAITRHILFREGSTWKGDTWRILAHNLACTWCMIGTSLLGTSLPISRRIERRETSIFPPNIEKNCTFLYYLREKYKIKLIVRKPNLECLIQISLVVYGSNTHLGVQVQQKPQRRSGPFGIHVTMKEHHDFQNHPILTFLHYLYLCLPSRSSFYSLSLSLLLCW